jgi:hypothetical protein
MIRMWWTLALLLLATGCGRNLTAKQIDEPCTRTAQCEAGLVCLAGVCQASPDAGADAGTDGGP